MIALLEGSLMQQDWLYRIARALHYQGLNSQDVLRTALSMTCSAIDVKQACILTFGEDGKLRDAFLLGSEVENQQELWTKLISEGLVGFVQHGQRTINLRNLSTDPRWPRGLPGTWKGSAVGIPLMYHTALYGALLLIHPEVDHFHDDVSEFLEEAAGLIAAAYSNARGAEKLKSDSEAQRQQYEQIKREQSESTQVEQLRRDLSAMTYHDLRGLLQNIYTSLCGMDQAVSSDKMARSLLRLATQSTRQMTRMVKGLLDIDRLEQGSTVITKRQTALRPLLNDMLELVSTLASEAEQELTCDLAEPLPDIQIDADMITRVLVNLIENAIKHTPAGGQVTVRVRGKENMAYFSVSDTGPGIPPDYQQDVFDKYYRIRHADAPNGVGLGLAFCRLAVEAHGGRIWVENQPSGGAVFTFTLPLEPVAVPAQV